MTFKHRLARAAARGALGVALVSAAGVAAAAPIIAPARAQPFHETVFGVAIDDPYRWMESPDNAAELKTWIVSSSDASEKWLAAQPEREAFVALLNQAMRAGVRYTSVTAAGSTLIYRRQDAADPTPRLVVRDGAGERILIAPAAGEALGAYSVSPDASLVAAHVSPGGGEVGAIHFIEVASAKDEGGALEPVWGEMTAAWLGPRVVSYTRMADPGAAPDPMQNMRAMVTEIGKSPGQPVLGAGLAASPPFQPREFPMVFKGALGDYALGVGGTARADQRVFVAPAASLIAGAPQWRVVSDYANETMDAALSQSDVYRLTSLGAPNGKIVRQPLAGGAAETVLPESSLVLEHVEAASDGVYVSGQRDGVSHLLFLPGGRGPAREVALPPESNLSNLSQDRDGSSVTLSLNGWTSEVAYYRARGGVLQPLGLASDSWSGAKGVRAIRDEAKSADGTMVPLVMLVPPGWSGGPLPTILESYGAYGVNNSTPWYDAPYLAWVAHGGAVAWCGTRGGNERGRQWHEDGRAGNKPKAQADFIGCAERLIATGKTTAHMLVATGTSAGGTLVPAAVLKRPELFAGLIPRVAMVNATRLSAMPNGPNQYAEFGDATTAEGFHALVSEDSYLTLAGAHAMPPMLFTLGLNDHRVVPWNGAKFTALARAKFGDRALVLIRADAEAGHGVGSAREVQIAEFADTFAFAWAVTHMQP